uniref:Choline-specific glycerophosphodiester phosphodiesterase n=1 Tax=Panagrellus redivivus TaxID=6233 RepID=A0A7E4VRT0_PANRE
MLRALAFTVLSISLVVGENSSPPAKGQNVVILLIDGYGAELFNRTNSAIRVGAEALLTNGVKAGYLRPVFPTLTYPNWFSLATGLYVESHNFTSDYMYDEEHNIYFERDEGPNDTNHIWWEGLPDPLWYTVGKANIDVHCYWFGSCHRPHRDLIVQVPKPRRHNFKNHDVVNVFNHLEGIFKHVKKYQQYKQQLVLLRYNGIANALRQFGEESDAINDALSNADVLIRDIQEKMTQHELLDSTNLIVLSDHGLMEIYEDEKYYIEDCISDLSLIQRVVNSLSIMMVYPVEGNTDRIFFELKSCDQWLALGDYDSEESPVVQIYRKEELPDTLYWKHSRNIGPIVLIARPGAAIISRDLPTNEVLETHYRDLHVHSGWDNHNPEMQGIFMARGPAFKPNEEIPSISIIDIQPLVLNILDIESKHTANGSLENIQGVLTAGWEDRTATDDASTTSFLTAACLTVVGTLVRHLM